MFKTNINSKPVLTGCIWFIHDEPGITEKVPYMNENNMLDAIREFHNKYGANHETEFMIIFTDPANHGLNAKIKEITGNEYDPVNMNTQPYLF